VAIVVVYHLQKLTKRVAGWKARKVSHMVVEEPEQGDSGRADNEEEELNVPVLIIGELVNEYLRARDVDEDAASVTHHNHLSLARTARVPPRDMCAAACHESCAVRPCNASGRRPLSESETADASSPKEAR
jgi:hypothetical protein